MTHQAPETVSIHFNAKAPTLDEQLALQGLRFRDDYDPTELQEAYDLFIANINKGIVPEADAAILAKWFSEIVARRVEANP